MTTNSVNLLEMVCQDPIFGPVDRYLMTGGSWFEADQMHWHLLQRQAIEGLCSLTADKPTKSNQERAELLLNHLKESSTQLFPTQSSLAIYLKAESMVKSWVPPVKAKTARKRKHNSFSALDSEEE
jgi:hypothetical protein